MAKTNRTFINNLLAVVIGISMFVILPTTTWAKTYTMKFNIPAPKTHPAAVAVTKFKEMVEKKSQGRINVKLYFGGSLYRDDDTQYSAVRSNVIQAGPSTGSRMAGLVPAAAFYELPFVFDSKEHARRFFYGPKGYAMKGPGTKALRKHYRKKGFRLLAVQIYPMQNFISSKGFLVAPEDYKGVKFRIRQSKIAAENTTALGGSPQPIAYMESYTALQLKTVDAAECPLIVIFAAKWHETGNYVTMSKHSALLGPVIMNAKWFDKLPKDLQAIIDEAAGATINAYFYVFGQKAEAAMPTLMKKGNPDIQFKELTMSQRAVLKKMQQSVVNKYKKDIPQDVWDAVETTRP